MTADHGGPDQAEQTPDSPGHSNAGDGAGHIVSARILIAVLVALLVLTWLTVAISKLDLGQFGLAAALGVATLKATLVVLFFMHLYWAKPIIPIVFGLGLVLTGLFVGLTLIDIDQVQPDLIANYAPDINGRTTAENWDVYRGIVKPPPGQDLYARTCQICHGESGEGNRALAAPALFRLNDWYVVAQLEKFRAGLRGTDSRDTTGQTMQPMATSLSDEEIVQVATFIKTLPGAPTHREIEGDVSHGGQLYEQVCASCHGPEGEGLRAQKSSTLAGQDDWYLVAQLQKFKAGIRGTTPGDTTGSLMQAMSAVLPDDQAIRDVTAYISTLGSNP